MDHHLIFDDVSNPWQDVLVQQHITQLSLLLQHHLHYSSFVVESWRANVKVFQVEMLLAACH